MVNISIAKDADELSIQFAEWLIADIAGVLSTHERYTIALSGGSTPKKLFRLLRTEAFVNRIDWSRLHFFWGDERFVPFEDERNNARMTYDELLSHVPVLPDNIHVMDTSLPPAEAEASYEKILKRYFTGEQTFDLVMLGMGADGHTLSLFPGYDVVDNTSDWVTTFYLREQEMYRITLTAGLVNNARAVAFLVTGSDKASALKEVLEGAEDRHRYPSQVIRPVSGKLMWYLDDAAAKDLSESLKSNANQV